MEYPKFCKGCTCVPEGVIAEVVTVTLPSQSEIDYIADNSGTKPEADYARLDCVVVESTNPDIEIGDRTRVTIDSRGRNGSEIREDIRNCPGPKKGKAKFLGALTGQGGCPAVKLLTTGH